MPRPASQAVAVFICSIFCVWLVVWNAHRSLQPSPLRLSTVSSPRVSSANSTQPYWPRVVLFGDSFTELSFSEESNWGAILADRLRRRADVLMRGFDGYNSRQAREILPRIFHTFGYPPDVVCVFVVLLGTNDACPWSNQPGCRVPLEEYKENLKWIVNYVIERGVGVDNVVLVSPWKVNGVLWSRSRKLPFLVPDSITVPYVDACAEVADEINCGFVDGYGVIDYAGQRQNWTGLLGPDGLHFSPEGSRVFADALWPYINKRTFFLPRVQ